MSFNVSLANDLDLAELAKHALCYIATPYSKYPGGIDAAFCAACRITGALIAEGVKAFSPIAHTHPIAKACGMDPFDHAVWMPSDRPMMGAASALVVVKLPGWCSSIGIAEEIKTFAAAGKPIFYLAVPHITG